MIIVELIGVVAAAISGAMAAIEKGADVFGVMFLAVITALGGGILRDVMLGSLPPRMFTSYVYVALALAASLAVFIIAYTHRESYRAKKEKADAILNVFDAVGLASFTVVGMDIAIAECGIENPVLVILLGMTTGFGGGMLRDTITNTMPGVLRKHVYAVASMAGALVYYALLRFGVDATAGGIACMVIIFALRMLATRYKWNLPRIKP